jgi:chromosome segregation ATPase
VRKAEAESALAHDRAHDLEARIEVSKDLEKELTRQNDRLAWEGDFIREKVEGADARVTDTQRELMALSAENARLVLERDTLLEKLKTAEDLIGGLQKEVLECQLNLSTQEGSQRAIEEIAEKSARKAEQRIQELDSKTSSLRSELGELTQHLAVAETASNQHEQELLALKERNIELEQSEKQLLERATNITTRYERGDLVRGVINVR